METVYSNPFPLSFDRLGSNVLGRLHYSGAGPPEDGGHRQCSWSARSVRVTKESPGRSVQETGHDPGASPGG
ncbi:MAG TPA: hypothetical protein EYO07_00140 [Candidatus Marinimicrobia bacterium]|nr:hypothetical protein [Candidatus Neomarinimicrobiota bacterium]